ncbi:MFS transporter [Cumulibacter soli]|uniref:MFS transporter n=1 Tax=Cumulibacter soli TaxID=2546344 RepID=UPI001067A8E1|nr:MFS transporter [Cumulibacter soli]
MSLASASIDATIVATALSQIQEDLDAPITWGAWTITGYNLAQVVVMPIAGKIADIYGPRRVFIGAASLYIVMAILCGLAPTIYTLVALRTIQAVGGGAFMPTGTAIVAATFGAGRAKALGLFTSIFSIGSVLGPVIGGVVVHLWSWRAIFICNLPLMIASLILGIIFLPKTTTRTGQPLDVIGALQLATMLLCGMLAITMVGNGVELLSVGFLAPLVTAALAALWFARHTRNFPHPFVPPRLLAGRGFATMNLVNVLFGAFAIGTTALLPLYAQDRYGLGALESGSLLSLRAIGMVSVTGIAVLLLHRTGYRRPIAAGIIIVAAGLCLIAVYPAAGVTPYLWLSIAAGITGIGMGVAMPAANNATLHLAPDQIAAVSGLRGMFRQIGGIAAISVATAVAAQSADPGRTLAVAFAALAVAALCVVPLTRRVPEDPAVVGVELAVESARTR